MHQFFRRNSKKLLAIVGVFLMVSFVATARMPNAGDRAAVLVGMIGDQKLLSTEVDAAKSDYRLLAETLVFQDRKGEWQPLFHPGVPLTALGEEPKLFVLLQKEAQQMGITASDQSIDQQLSRYIGVQLAFRSITGTVVPFSDLSAADDADRVQQIQSASQHLLLVLMGLYRAIDVNKVSQPLRDLTLAEEHQSIQVKMVAFDARKQLPHVAAPNTQQLEKQFNDFADVPASGMLSKSDPFGFGYQEKERFRLEVISVKRAAVTAVVQKTQSDYDWDVAAHYYYDKHLADYPATQPTTLPAEALVAAPTTRPAATTRPFDAVKADVMAAVMKPKIDELNDKVQHQIEATLAADWAAYHAAHPAADSAKATSMPSSEPMTSLGVPYSSGEYLPALAAKIQKDLGVLPVVDQINKPVTVDEAPHIAGVGSARSADSSVAFVDAMTDPSLLPLQPSVPLTDDAATSYTFRIQQRIAAHRPASMNDVASVVESDWKLSQAFELCRIDAAQLQADAKAHGLAAAAKSMNVNIDVSAAFGLAGQNAQEPIKGLPLTGESVEVFRAQCQSLLTDAAEQKPAITLVESPRDAKIVVAELSSVTPDWPEGYRQFAEAQTTAELRRELSQPIASQWFNLSAVSQRLNYKDVGADKTAS